LPEFTHWEIGKLELKPGQIIVLRYTPEKYPGPGGDRPDPRHTAAILDHAAKEFANALDLVGLKGRAHVLAMTDQFDINTICPLEFMDMCVQAKDEQDRGKT
jgi:hypothetical protein